MIGVKDARAEPVTMRVSMEATMVDRKSFMPAPRAYGTMRVPWPRGRGSRLLCGALLFASGAAAVAWVFLAAFSADPALAAWGLRLGLAWGTLVSGLGQTAMLIGFWLLWAAARRR